MSLLSWLQPFQFDEADGKLTVVYFDEEEDDGDAYEFDSKTAGKVKPWTDPVRALPPLPYRAY